MYQGFSQKCWVHHVMLENGEKQMETNVVLAREDETVVMTMDRMRLREVRPEHIAKMLAAAAGDADEDILEVQWTALELKDGKAKDLGKVLFVDAPAELQAALAAAFPKAVCGDVSDLASEAWGAVVHLGALGQEAVEMEVLASAMELAQASMQRAQETKGKSASPLWWITRGTMGTGTVAGYQHAGLWGMARTFRMEERAVALRCLDLDVSLAAPSAVAEALGSWMGKLAASAEGETEVLDHRCLLLLLL